MSYLFVGEKPSKRAEQLGITWTDGGLAAKQLFDGLQANNIDPHRCGFVNLFGDQAEAEEKPQDGVLRTLKAAADAGVQVVAMGRKTQYHLAQRRVPHRFIVHPAARGTIRAKDKYAAHLKEMLK